MATEDTVCMSSARRSGASDSERHQGAGAALEVISRQSAGSCGGSRPRGPGRWATAVGATVESMAGAQADSVGAQAEGRPGTPTLGPRWRAKSRPSASSGDGLGGLLPLARHSACVLR